jgi:hypothetical protein
MDGNERIDRDRVWMGLPRHARQGALSGVSDLLPCSRQVRLFGASGVLLPTPCTATVRIAGDAIAAAIGEGRLHAGESAEGREAEKDDERFAHFQFPVSFRLLVTGCRFAASGARDRAGRGSPRLFAFQIR